MVKRLACRPEPLDPQGPGGHEYSVSIHAAETPHHSTNAPPFPAGRSRNWRMGRESNPHQAHHLPRFSGPFGVPMPTHPWRKRQGSNLRGTRRPGSRLATGRLASRPRFRAWGYPPHFSDDRLDRNIAIVLGTLPGPSLPIGRQALHTETVRHRGAVCPHPIASRPGSGSV